MTLSYLITYWEQSYYTPLVTLLLSGLGLIFTIKKASPRNPFNALILFFAFHFALEILANAEASLSVTYDTALFQLFLYADLSTTVVEACVFCYIITKILRNPRFRTYVTLLAVIFCIVVGLALVFALDNFHLRQEVLQKLFTTQAAILIAGCAFYFVDLFGTPPTISLLKSQGFWIITGLTVFSVCTLPFSLFGDYLLHHNFTLYLKLFSIFGIFYCLLFIMIMYSYSCATPTK